MMNKFTHIQTQRQLQSFVDESLQHCLPMVIDTEFVREKTYYPRLCLIQIKTNNQVYCIDTLSIQDISYLGEVFANPRMPIVFHAAKQDIEALKTRIEKDIVGIEDTQIAAAFCGYGDSVSYAGLVESICHVVLEKSYTRTDWAKRPLSEKQWQYAVEDVEYLPAVRDYLNQKLLSSGKMSWYDEECKQLSQYDTYVCEPKDAWKKLKGGGAKLAVTNQYIAQSLCAWRERVAQEKNLPREWVMSSTDLLTLSFYAPQSSNEIAELSQLSKSLLRRYSRDLLSVITHTQQAMVKAMQKSEQGEVRLPLLWKRKPRIEPQQRDIVRDIMRRLQKLADESSIGVSLLSNKRDIEKMVAGTHDIALLRGWRKQLVGAQLLEEYGLG